MSPFPARTGEEGSDAGRANTHGALRTPGTLLPPFGHQLYPLDCSPRVVPPGVHVNDGVTCPASWGQEVSLHPSHTDAVLPACGLGAIDYTPNDDA